MLESVEQSCVLAYFGMFFTFLFVASLLCKMFNLLRVHLFSRCASDLRKYGQWAVITGGSSGIGREYANELARRGLDIVIVSNDLEALKATAEEIQTRHGVRCRYLHVDLSEEDAYERLSKSLNNAEVGILVNCAGIVGDFPCLFLEETDRDEYLMIDLHIRAVVHVTRLILPSMLERKRGVIVNISSLASVKALPLMCVYSSCKAFSDRFTRALSYEYKHINVRFQSLTPNVILTPLVLKVLPKVSYPGLLKFCHKPDCFVRNAVRTANVTDHTAGHWFDEFVSCVLPYLPDRVWMFFMAFFFSKFSKRSIKRE